MKIALYFGSFNPVHNGHLIIANYVANYFPFDQVWFVISPLNPLKKSASLLNEYHRKHMIDLCLEGEKKLRTSNVEFKLPKPSYTIDTLTYLEEKYPKDTFVLIIGSDAFSNIQRWKNYEMLLEKYEVVIYKREGFQIETGRNKNIKIARAPLLDISSSLVRNMIKTNKSIRFLVPDIVKEEIESKGYYKEKSKYKPE